MNYEQALVTKLEATTAITNLVSTRIYPNVIPADSDLPSLAFQRITGMRTKFHDNGIFWDEARIQFTVRAATYSSAKSVISALKTALSGITGNMGVTGGPTVYDTTIDMELDGYDQEAGYYTVRLDIKALYKE